MQAFDYAAPTTLDETVQLLTRHGAQARPMAGGTDLIAQLREGRRSAGVVVDVKRVPELSALVVDAERGLTIGAAVPMRRIYGDADIAARYPGLIDAVSLVGGIAIQGRASIGGNLCTASPAGDTIPALIAHRAVCVIAGPGGLREVNVEDFAVGPGKTVLGAGEVLVQIKVPAPPAGFGAAYLRFIPRNEMDIAEASCGASLVLDAAKAKIISARVALGAVAPTPLFVAEAGAALAGRAPDADAIEAAAVAARDAARPIDDMRGTVEHRKQLSYVLTRRVLAIAVERARAA